MQPAPFLAHWLLCRRQEIVFIGAGMDEAAISKQLDQALLTDAEMGEYDARYKHVCPCNV